MNKKCLIVLNSFSGGYKDVDVEKLKAAFGKGFDVETFIIKEGNDFSYQDVDRVVICGGDGTINRAYNQYVGTNTEVIYCPHGTLNETSKKDKLKDGIFEVSDCGKANKKIFTYVFATGQFTPLGYVVDFKIKQKIKAFAYIAACVKQLKIRRINAKITADGVNYEGQYSLIMALDSPQCFQLPFNKMYQVNDNKLHMLIVKAPRFNGFFGLVELFFPFFRAFFIGFKKPYESKRMVFKELYNMDLQFDKEYDFCVDGEKWTMPTAISVKTAKFDPILKIVTSKGIEKLVEENNGK